MDYNVLLLDFKCLLFRCGKLKRELVDGLIGVALACSFEPIMAFLGRYLS
jgi:hypothetical protein